MQGPNKGGSLSVETPREGSLPALPPSEGQKQGRRREVQGAALPMGGTPQQQGGAHNQPELSSLGRRRRRRG